ncbi:uncharacterized protein TNCV_1125831 [Trichonephila clavipes]|nr:uncharacterized protein TNCV_1125831 [Trichonephila clavipes]
MITNYMNDQHDTWDQFLREFAYAIQTAVNETTGKNPAKLFSGRKLITPFQKLVMLSDGTEFAVGGRNRLMKLEETQRLSIKSGRNIRIDADTMCKLRVLEVKNNNLVIWRSGKRLTVNVDQVRIYSHKKSDEIEIRTGSSDSNSSRLKSSNFESVQQRSNESQYGRKKWSGVKRELEEKGIRFFKEGSGSDAHRYDR